MIAVAAIVGLLATISIISYANVKKNARDSKRKLDLKAIQRALDVYYQDNNAYPSTGGGWWGTCVNGGAHPNSGANGFVPNLAPAYIGQLPVDPTGINRFPAICGADNAWACYLYNGNAAGTGYKLIAHCTPEGQLPAVGDPFYEPNRSTYAIGVCDPFGVGCAW